VIVDELRLMIQPGWHAMQSSLASTALWFPSQPGRILDLRIGSQIRYAPAPLIAGLVAAGAIKATPVGFLGGSR
jgi:hypothetical protein